MIADLLPTDEQQQIEDSVSGTLTRLLPLERLRDEAASAAGAEMANWPAFVEAGLFGLGLDADLGGVGYGLPEEVIVSRLLGRAVASSSVLATMIAAHVAASGGDAGLTEQIVSGKKRAAFANPTSAGEEVQLIDAAQADLLVGWRGDQLALFAQADIAGARPIRCIDETVSLARALLPNSQLAASAPASRLSDRTSLLVAAYLVGLSERTRDMAVDYAQVRQQFGQQIGAFQAVKHICADMAVRSEVAQAQTYLAAVQPDSMQIAAARVLAGQAALENGRANIQVHGGIGFTFEADAHRLLKRAHVMVVLASSDRAEKERIVAR